MNRIFQPHPNPLLAKERGCENPLGRVSWARTGRNPRSLFPYTLAILAVLCSGWAAFAAPRGQEKTEPAAAKPPTAADLEFFEKKVRPLLFENCFGCHGEKTRKANLRLDSRAAILKGGDRGAVILPGDPEKSLLVQAIGYQDPGLQMPPKGRLPEEARAILTEWVKRGAPWPTEAKPGAGTNPPAAVNAFDLQKRKNHWAWQTVKRVSPPVVKNPRLPLRNPIDAFLLAKMAAKGITPAPPADRRTLLRRVTYDLIGLPPTPEEIAAFLADMSPNAYEKVVDRLLASPHYGERWARHWLDLVRFAETDGHEFDFEKPGAYHYRDYVIRALNADVPYNQFVMEHIAGDLLPNPRKHPTEGFNESLLATGFWWLGEGKHSPVDIRVDQSERADNQIDVMSKTFLGLSLGCARCHDHKFDAISTNDYYALAGFLRSSRYHLAALENPAKLRQTAQALAQVNAELKPMLVSETAANLSRQFETLPESLMSARSDMNGSRLAVQSEEKPAPKSPRERWTAYLRDVAVRNPADPFHPWAILSRSALSPDAFRQARMELVNGLRDLSERAREEAKRNEGFEDFTADTYRGWYVTGEAFGAGPVKTAAVATEENDRLRLTGLLGAGVADSGGIGERLHGTLRSRTVTLSKNWIWIRMAGKAGQARLVIDGFQRIMAPIYGGLALHVNDPALTWYGIDVSKWIGHRAYIEFLDNGPGWITVDRIVFRGEGRPTDAPNPLLLAMLDDKSLTSMEALARSYQALLAETARLWASGRMETDPEYDSRRELMDWMLRHELPASENAPKTVAESSKLASLSAQRRELEAKTPTPTFVMATVDGTSEDEFVHIRGNCKTLGAVSPRRFLEAIDGPKTMAIPEGSGRLTLAKRMTDPANPLTARVIVNRLWQHHFGEGIVRTPDDFGLMGQRPTHPELLDWLASVFVAKEEKGKTTSYACDWSLKKMHRLMVLSSAYRMSNRGTTLADQRDPQNLLLHKMPVRRLEAEVIRDAILAVSGRLDRKLYGPSVLPYLTPFMEGRGRPNRSGPLDGDGRRSIYLGVRRNFLTPMFLAFDYPVPFNTMGRRTVSNVPAQALTMMNNPFVVEQAGVWAKRILAEPAPRPEARVSRLYLSAFGRPPTSKEMSAALDFLTAQAQPSGNLTDPRIWSDLCHVLFNVKEFVFRD